MHVFLPGPYEDTDGNLCFSLSLLFSAMEQIVPMEETTAVDESPGPLDEESPAKWVLHSFSPLNC